jgi:hypothetical protein
LKNASYPTSLKGQSTPAQINTPAKPVVEGIEDYEDSKVPSEIDRPTMALVDLSVNKSDGDKSNPVIEQLPKPNSKSKDTEVIEELPKPNAKSKNTEDAVKKQNEKDTLNANRARKVVEVIRLIIDG